jgi:hypothetical protein
MLQQRRTNPDGSPVDFLQCLYMTVISTFTVGYGEVIFIVTPADQLYTMIVIVLGDARQVNQLKDVARA